MIFRTAAATAARAISSCKRCEGKPPGRFAHRAIELRWSLLNRRALGARVVRRPRRLRCEHVLHRRRSGHDHRLRRVQRGVAYVTSLRTLGSSRSRPAGAGLSDELRGSVSRGLRRRRPSAADSALQIPSRAGARKSGGPDRPRLRDRAQTACCRRRRRAPLRRVALDFARESRPAMIVVCGLSGSGKSTVARRLADWLGFEWLRSDEIRKRLAGVAPAERLSELRGRRLQPRVHREELRRPARRGRGPAARRRRRDCRCHLRRARLPRRSARARRARSPAGAVRRMS